MKDKQAMVDAALVALDQNRIRCSYRALAQFIGGHEIGVSKYLGSPRPEASWVVSLETKRPTGYARADCHPELLATRRMIYTGEALAKLIENIDQI